VWLHGGSHRHQLTHQLVVNVETPTGIEYDKIVPLVSSPFHASLADANDIRLGSLGLIDSMHVDGKISPQSRQLIAGCRTTRIRRNQENPFPLSLEVPPELAAGRRLSSTLEPYHHDDRGGIRGQSQTGPLAAHHLPQLLPHDLDDLMTRGQALEDFLTNCLFANSLDEVLDDLEVNVGFEQREANFFQSFRDVLFGEDPRTA
jgi:hypothetical protein